MLTRIKKRYVFIYIALSLVYIFEAIAGSRNIAFIFLLLFLPYIIKYYPNRALLGLIAPLILVLFFSLIGTFSSIDQVSNYQIFRDVFYILQAPLVIYIGGILFLRFGTMEALARGLTVILTLASAFMLFGAFEALIGGASYAAVRYDNPYYSSAPITLFILSLASEMSGKRIITRRFSKIVMAISVAAIILSFSRLQYFTATITIILFAYQLRSLGDTRLRNKVAFFVFLTFVGAFVLITKTQIFDEAFIIKFQNSIDEVFSFEDATVGNELSLWRAYEMLLVVEKFRSADLFTYSFGYGLGSGVVLPFSASESLQAGELIPILHNSFGTVLLKSGFFGLAAYVFFYLRAIYSILKMSRLKQLHSTDRLFGYFVSTGILVHISIGAFVTHGLYTNSLSYSSLLLLGSSVLASIFPHKTLNIVTADNVKDPRL